MKKIMTLLTIALAFTACSKEESPIEKVSQKVDQINTENADAAVQAIKTPINKARATQNLGEERTEGIDQAMQNLNK
jgi:PBP1b-binding outer membrane lipoprotein LpoB